MNIFMDMEMQNMINAPKEIRKIWSREVIEIGAVAIDDRGKECGEFREYVKPQYSERITRGIKELTGISTGQVAGAEGFEKVFHRFMAWCASLGSPVVYAWSESDLTQILKECGLKNVTVSEEEEVILKGWKDLQKEFDDLAGSSSPTGLEKALNLCGEEYDGRRHDARWDAKNTAKVYLATRDREAFLKSLADLRRALDRDEEPLTLGSMIDFSGFSLSA